MLNVSTGRERDEQEMREKNTQLPFDFVSVQWRMYFMYRNHYERFKTYTPKTSHTLLLAHAVSLLLFSSDENKQEKKSKNSNTLSHVHEKKICARCTCRGRERGMDFGVHIVWTIFLCRIFSAINTQTHTFGCLSQSESVSTHTHTRARETIRFIHENLCMYKLWTNL